VCVGEEGFLAGVADYRTLLQNMVSFLGLFCKRDLSFVYVSEEGLLAGVAVCVYVCVCVFVRARESDYVCA